jgi:hypothetical protein
MGRCHGEAAMSLLAKFRGEVFACFHAIAAKLLSITGNLQFGLVGMELRATTPAPVRNILDTTS